MMTCICGETQMIKKKYSKNFNQSVCLNCRSICFHAIEGVSWFNYDSANDKYSDEIYLAHGEFRWAHSEILNLLKNSKGRMLELGTFNGFFANQLSTKLKIDVYGEDMNEEAIKVGKEIYPAIALKLGSVNEFDNNQYDGVILIDVFEHVSEPSLFVENIRKRLKPDGKIFLSGPTVERLFHDRSDCPPHHPWRYSSQGLIEFFRNNGFKLVEHRVERNGPLLLRNLVGVILAKFPKEFHGEGLRLKPKKNSRLFQVIFNYVGFFISILLHLFKLQYCSQLMVYEKV